VARTNYVEGHVFFTTKVFTLNEVTITLEGNVDEMPLYCDTPCNYITNDVGFCAILPLKY
jgi:hypothetical protein